MRSCSQIQSNTTISCSLRMMITTSLAARRYFLR
nr:MAG TPA: hypothetical protein [Caudoviricetes sp.]